MRPRLLAALGLGALIVGAGLSLARFEVHAADRGTAIVWDLSRSSRLAFASDADYADWLARETLASLGGAAARPAKLALSFGERAEPMALPEPTLKGWRALALRQLARDGGQASGFDRALAEVEQVADQLERVFVFSDGSYRGADPAPRLAALTARGIQIERSAPPMTQPDLAVLELNVAPKYAVGQAVDIGFALGLTPSDAQTGPAYGLLEVRAEPLGQAGAPQRSVQLWPSTGLFELTPETPKVHGTLSLGALPEGAWRLTATLETGGLSRGQRSLVRAFVVGPRKRLVVAYNDAQHFGAPVEERIERARAFFTPFPAGFWVDLVPASRVAEVLPDADVLVTWDVPLGALPGAAIANHVQSGMGLFCLGSFGLLDAIKPADPELLRHMPMVPDERDVPARQVILCVDGSGSMEGAPFDAVRRAAIELVRAAPARDEVSLTFFTNALGALWTIRPAQVGPLATEVWSRARQDAELEQLMNTHVPGGDTRILDAMASLLTWRRSHIGTPTLVILLSDGAENGVDISDPLQLIETLDRAKTRAAELRAANTELTVISILGGERDPQDEFAARTLLFAFVKPGEDLIEVALDGKSTSAEPGESEALSNVFARAVAGAMVIDGGANELGRPRTLALLPPDDNWAAPFVPLDGALRAMGRFRLRPGAELIVSGLNTIGQQGPLLALREGAGRVAVLATEPRSAWAANWTHATGLTALLTHLAQGRDLEPEAWVEGDRVVVDLGAAGGIGVGKTQLVLTADAGTTSRITPFADPLRPGLWLAPLPESAREAWLTRIDVLDDKGRQLASLGLERAAPGGEVDPGRPRWDVPPAPSLGPVGPRSGPHPSAPWVLGIGLLLVMSSLFGRA